MASTGLRPELRAWSPASLAGLPNGQVETNSGARASWSAGAATVVEWEEAVNTPAATPEADRLRKRRRLRAGVGRDGSAAVEREGVGIQ